MNKMRLALPGVLALLLVATTTVPATAASTQPSTHSIEYHVGCGQAMIWDGSLDYFKAYGFSTVHLVVRDQKPYKEELVQIKSLGMKGIIDIEIPIWDAGKKKSVPIENFASYFQSLKAAGWEYVASEGGRAGDANYLARYFKGYVNYNCDQCGLWKDMHLQSGTVMNSWESFYPKEWQYIQQGAKDSTALGKKNGILAGVWGSSKGVDYNPILTNSKNGGSPSYKSMLDWSYSNGVGFTHFHVWCSINSNGLASYKQLGFEQIVTELQKTYPATTAASSGTSASKAATPTPKATATVKEVSTVKATATVKEVSTVKATTQPAKTAPLIKAIATPTQQTAGKEVISTTSSSDVLRNSSVLELSVPSAPIDNSSDLSPQPILEFSLLGIGVPLAIAGAIYMFMRRR